MILDDGREIARIDAGGMLGLVGRLGPMTVEGWEAAASLPLPARGAAARPAAVVAAGMGGSGIGGDLLRAILAPTAAIPVIAVRDDRLPAFVGRDTLAFLCSYSGDTEETLAAYEAAHAAGASIVVVTSGGRLADRARAGGHPVVLIPSGLPAPRAALPYLLMPMLRVAARMDIARIADGDVREAAAVLTGLADRWGPTVPTADNPPKRLAARLGGCIPVIYAASQATEPVAHRWKTQLNENSKVFAVWNAFPELGHNETVGWAGASRAPSGLFVVILRDRDDGARTTLQVEVTRTLVFGRARGVEDVWSAGDGLLARLLSLVLFGDLVSVYLAVQGGVDPTPIEVITEMKRKMQEGSRSRGTV